MATEEEQKNTVLALMWKKSLAEKKKNNKYNEHRGNYDAKKTVIIRIIVTLSNVTENINNNDNKSNKTWKF